MIVAFPRAASDATIEEVGRTHGMHVAHRTESKVLDRRLVLFVVNEGRDIAALTAALAADPRVAHVQADKLYQAFPSQSPQVALEPFVPLPKRPIAKTRAVVGRALAANVPKRRYERAPQRTAAAEERSNRAAEAALRFPTADEPFVGPATSQR